MKYPEWSVIGVIMFIVFAIGIYVGRQSSDTARFQLMYFQGQGLFRLDTQTGTVRRWGDGAANNLSETDFTGR